MDALLLDQSRWDLVLDAAGNIAVASDPYALAQNVATAIRLFSGELWYDTAQGIPYFEQVLGHSPPIALLKQYFVDAALGVTGVAAAQCFLSGFANRVVTGQVQITSTDGTVVVVSIGGGALFVLGSAASPVGSGANVLG